MLIIAIPKSASTSLIATLGKAYLRPATQDIFADQEIPEGYPIIGRYHSDARLITDEQVIRWGDAAAFYKQHIPPADPNLRRLRSTRIVLLLRDPDEIVLAYRRAEIAGLHPERPEFAGCSTEQQWLDRAASCGLLRELEDWTHGWQDAPVEKLVLSQRELITATDEALDAIANFWGLPRIRGSVELARERYSRIPTGWRQYMKRLFKAPGLA